MKKTLIYSVILSFMLIPFALQAQELSLKQLQTRLSKLESIINHTQPSHPLNNLKVSGVLEVETTHTEGFNDSQEDTSDTRLATFELAMATPVNQYTEATVTFLYEEQDTPFEVDTASISISDNSNLNLTFGQVYLPFGAFETHQVNDTLALEIAEIRNSALIAGYGRNGFSAQGYVFATQENKLNQGGFRVGFRNNHINVYTDFINNALNSDAFQTLAEEDPQFSNLTDTPAISVHLGAQISDLLIQCEHLALDSIGGLNITSSQLEASYHFDNFSLALSLQQTKDAQALNLPLQRVSYTTTMNILHNTQLAIELWRDENKDHHLSNNFIIQAAVTF